MRDIRIFPIFEGANDVMRAFIALSAMKPVGERLSELGEIGLNDPIRSIGVLADYVAGRVQREVRPERISMAHPELAGHADAVGDQVKELAAATESLIRKHKKDVTLPAARPEAARRRDRRRLRPGRGAEPGHLDLRERRRRAIGPGALHRRHVLHPCRRAASAATSAPSSTTTTSG